MTHDAQSLPQAFLDEIKSALSEKSWSLDIEEISPHLEDWRGNYRGHSQLLLKPASTEEVAIAVKLCAKHNVAITPQGGNTGLVNAGLAHGEVVLSLKRMNTVRDVDPLNNSITVDAGCILTSVHSAAEDNEEKKKTCKMVVFRENRRLKTRNGYLNHQIDNLKNDVLNLKNQLKASASQGQTRPEFSSSLPKDRRRRLRRKKQYRQRSGTRRERGEDDSKLLASSSEDGKPAAVGAATLKLTSRARSQSES